MEELMNPVFSQLDELLRDGRINPKDLWLAETLLKDHLDGREVSNASVTWLKSLVSRGGEPFKGD